MASSRSLLLVASLALAGCAARGVPTANPEALAGLALTPTEGAPVPVTTLLARHDATVFVFWSAGCPCVRRYQARVEALAAAWSGRNVGFVQVSSNAGETLDSVRTVAKERSLTLPVWRDEGGLLARQLAARSTPTVVLLRKDGAVLYRGWLDNERDVGEADREPWLEQALEGFTAGTAFAARSPTWGCTITRSLVAPEAPTCHDPSLEVATSPATPPGGTP